MGYGISFGEPTIHLESMCGSSSSNPSTILEEIRNCTHFGEGCGPSSEISAKISEGVIQDSSDLAEPDAAWFSEEKAGPSTEIALENTVLEADVCGASKEKSGMAELVTHATSSCTDTDSTMVSLEKVIPLDVPGTVSSGVNEVLLPPLVNGSGISIAYTECVNASTGIDVAAVLKDDSSLEGTFSSVPSIVGCNSSGLETTGIKMESSANADKVVDSIIVSEDNVGMTQVVDSDPPGVVLPGANPLNKEESSLVEGTNTSIGELHCNDENFAMENTHKERERKPKPQEFIVFTRRNPKRSATHAESDLNIDRLTRISNRSRRTKKDKETFDSTPLVSLIRDPNLITNKRKPSSRRYGDSKWGDIVNLAQTVDLSLQFCKLKQEREAEVRRRQTTLKEKMGKNKISNQSVPDVKHLKQEVILDRDMDSTVTHEVSSVGHETVQRGTNERDAADPGSSPDSVVYNPLSCEANPTMLQQKQSPKNKRKKKKKGENSKPSRRDGLLNVSGNATQGTLYWFQIDNKRKSISKGKKEEKGQDLGAPGVMIKEKGNRPDPYNGVTIASVSGFSFDGTQEHFRHEGFLAQLLPPAKPLVPMHLVSTPVASGNVPVPLPHPSVPVTSNTKSIPGQPAMIPELPGQVPSVYLQPISSSMRSLHVPSPAGASGKPLQGKTQPAPAPLQLVDAPAQNIPASAKPTPKQRVAWVCCDDCEKWRCIPAELADVIDETNCRWTCKDNADKAFADCSIPQEKSNAEINAELEISDGSGDEGSSGQGDRLGDVNHMKPLVGVLKPHSSKSAKKALGPAPFTHLKTNLFLHRHRRSQTIDEIMVCNCKPPENGGMGCRSQCLNRMLNIECIKGMCPCGELCSNQQFQRRSYAKLMHFRSGKKGYGLQLLENVPSGRFLIEYVGEVLDMATYEARQKEYASRGQKHFYFMTLNGGEVIDACAKGNMGRFINHSCDPNCRTEKWIVNGEVCIGLFAIRDIKKGEELTFDYNYVRVVGAAAKKCFCGAANCRGYIGGDPSSTDIVVQEDSDEEDYFEPIKPKQQQVATSLDNSLRKQLRADKSQNIFGMSAPVVQKGKSDCKERLEGCKPTSAVSRLASSLVNGPMHRALAVPANSQEAFGPVPQGDLSRFNLHTEKLSESKIREKSIRLKTDVVFIKPSDSRGTSGSVNDGGLSRAIISSGSPFEISKPDYRNDVSWCKPGSLLSLPESYHEVCEPFDKEADKTRDIKDISQPSSSSIAVSSYSLLDMHLSRVNSLGEFNMGNVDQPSDAKLHINYVNECKPLEKESSLQGLSEKALLPNNSYEESELVDRNKLFQPLPEHVILQTNSYDTTENREVDDVSTPVLPDHQEDMDPDNLGEFSCVPGSSSDGYAQASLPEHLHSPTRDARSEEDTPHTPLHVTQYMSERVHSSQSGDMGYKARSDNDPYDSDLQTEHTDMYLTNPARHGQSTSPPTGSSGMKNVRTGASDDDVATCQDGKEMAQYTATPDFEGVEEKLNKLLDEDGSISRRKHAIKGYLKLLIVTAAAGDTGTLQRLRDLLLILDALLKTNSYNVLMNIMKTNGLQMLHTILKQNRDDFNRIPIIRKLLKVLGHLAEMHILTLEQMNQGPPRPGMESFRESIYKLTKHINKQVSQNAREFFDKWMPKSMRVRDSFSQNCNPSTSKRKSRWDQPSDSHGQNHRFPSNKSQAQNLERPSKRPHSKNPEEDAPPGFEHVGPPPGFESVSPSSFGSVVQPALGSCSNVVQVALGFRQERYRPGVSVSYGIPAVTAQTLGLLAQSEGSIYWGIAPSIPFKPFPPLPPPNLMIGNNNVQNNGIGFHNGRPRRRWNSNLRNRRFPRPWSNYEYARKNSNSQRSRKDWSKRPRDRR